MARKRANGEGSIRLRTDGLYEARITLDGLRRSRYAKTRAEAAAWLTVQLRNRDRGLPPELNERVALSTYLEDWLIRIAPTIRASTHRRYRELVTHAVRHLGKVTLTRLTSAHLERFYAILQRPVADGGAGLSSSSAHHAHAVLHKALEDARREGLVGRNVADIARAPHVREYEPIIWSQAQVQAFLRAAVQDRLGPLYVVTACTGMRSGEVRALRWKDVDLDARALQVRTALDRSNTPAQTKTRKSRRRVELPDLAVSALRAQRVRQAEERLAVGNIWHDGGLVFTTSIGTPLDGVNLLKMFHRLCDRADLPRLRIHDLRHLQASLLLAGGVNPKVVAERLGHSRVGITLDTYSHVMPTLQREAADVLDKLLGDWESLQASD